MLLAASTCEAMVDLSRLWALQGSLAGHLARYQKEIRRLSIKVGSNEGPSRPASGGGGAKPPAVGVGA